MKTLSAPDAVSLVLNEIQASADNLRAAKDYRLRQIRIARALGITHRTIGARAGITASAVIDILKRAGEVK